MNTKKISKITIISILLIVSIFVGRYVEKKTINQNQKINKKSQNITNQIQSITKSNYDVVIYGGTSAGITAACEVKKMGESVLVIEPTNRIGGMTTNGLGATDVGNSSKIGGLALEFYKNVGKKYNKNKPVWDFEPKVALSVFQDFINKYNIPVIYNQKLKLKDGVVKNGNKIVSITMESGKVYRGKVFIDATYEGDLMAEAGISYTTGREANSKYGESSNGVETRLATGNQLPKGIDPYVIKGNDKSGLLPHINSNPIAKDGTGDDKIQAYCFRLCLTKTPKNRIKIEKPKDYNELEYELLIRAIEKGDKSFSNLNILPNGKADLNNNGGISLDYIAGNYNYIESDYKTRDKILQQHKDYEEGFLWTLQNDPRIPINIRKFYSQWGLAKDEFTENSNWPTELYIREGRRMISDFVITEQYIMNKKTIDNSIGVGTYNMDSHNVQRYISNGYVKNEGDVQLSVKPYPISFDAIVPKSNECTNLLEPVCLSASHIAYGSIRLEPVFMILGQSAGAAAGYAVEDNVNVQDINYKELHNRLISDGQILN
jgi:ribulose 1,5-bisphosphate synthetase/thiazole synthase